MARAKGRGGESRGGESRCRAACGGESGRRRLLPSGLAEVAAAAAAAAEKPLPSRLRGAGCVEKASPRRPAEKAAEEAPQLLLWLRQRQLGEVDKVATFTEELAVGGALSIVFGPAVLPFL